MGPHPLAEVGGVDFVDITTVDAEELEAFVEDNLTMQQRNELYHREIHQRQISAVIIQHYWVRSRRREVSDFLRSMAHTLSLEDDGVYVCGCLVRIGEEAFRVASRSVPHTHELFESGEALRHGGNLLSARFSIRNTRLQPFHNDEDQVLRQHQQACL